ncbi:AEC family transporter [Desulfuromonas sp. CSMB_57]|jgi:hypothetical protein|uniref:AEC family transporter n=1 Tax=Desulfuromonas sp. CSMB_57 TaxID=2807629 RepID=UPI001CD267ED|nr:AEC family transporter [Desulfuromonas sp. CSMB_57]
MPHFFATLEIVLPVFVLILLGSLLHHLKLVDDNFSRQANRLVYFVFLPALLFFKTATAEFGTSFNAPLTLGASAALVLGGALAYGWGVLAGFPPADRGTFSQGAFRGNLAYVGLPIVFGAYGEGGLAMASMLLSCLVPLINLLAILVLWLPHRRKQRTGGVPWREQLLLNPLVLAAAAGLLWSWLAWPLPDLAGRILQPLSNIALPLALLAIGAGFSLRQLQGDLRRAGSAAALKLALQPFLNFLILMAMGFGGRELGIALLLAATPTAAASYIMAYELDGNPGLAASIIVLSTLLAAPVYTGLLLLLKLTGL